MKLANNDAPFFHLAREILENALKKLKCRRKVTERILIVKQIREPTQKKLNFGYEIIIIIIFDFWLLEKISSPRVTEGRHALLIVTESHSTLRFFAKWRLLLESESSAKTQN